MCCFPPKWLFVSDFLGFLRSKNLAWWPLNFRSPKALLLEKPSALNKERGGEKPLDVFTTKCCCPTPYCVARPLGPLLWIQGGPTPPHPQKMHNMGFFFLFLFSSLQRGKVFIQAMGPPSTQNTPTKRHVLFFCPHSQGKRGTSLSERKRNKEGKKENDNLGCQKKK
jgi:hypothetical protein